MYKSIFTLHDKVLSTVVKNKSRNVVVRVNNFDQSQVGLLVSCEKLNIVMA